MRSICNDIPRACKRTNNGGRNQRRQKFFGIRKVNFFFVRSDRLRAGQNRNIYDGVVASATEENMRCRVSSPQLMQSFFAVGLCTNKQRSVAGEGNCAKFSV